MKKVNFGRVLFVLLALLVVIFAVLKIKQAPPPVKKPVEAVPVEVPKVPEEPVKPAVHWKAGTFSDMPGWGDADLTQSFKAFKTSCEAFLRQPEDKPVGSDYFPLKASDWYPACRAANQLTSPSNTALKAFFESWFTPGEFYEEAPIEGLFTGYYVPIVEGSLQKTDLYTVPIYALPRNWVTFRLSEFDINAPDKKVVARVSGHQLYPYHTREEINQGAIEKFAPVLVWVKDQVDRLFLEIQGSGIIQLKNSGKIFIGYAGQNGAAYTSIAGVLIKEGVMTHDTASMQTIRAYFAEHPERMLDVINENKSFVFFQKQAKPVARGAQGVFLTSGYSLAVDRSWVPLGTPVWVDTTRPDVTGKAQEPLKRLFVAQDTGGAIKGPVRGDVFWGEGEKAGEIAGRMKNKGHYWLLMPRKTAK